MSRNPPLALIQQHSLQRKLLKDLLESAWKGSVYHFSDRSEFTEVQETRRFGMVFFELSGDLDTLRTVLEDWSCPAVAIVGRDEDLEDLPACFDAGLVDFVSKPYQPGEIEELCQSWQELLMSAEFDRIGGFDLAWSEA